MASTKEIESKIKSVKYYMIYEFGIDQIGYFGSFSNGGYTEESNLDMLVSLKRSSGWKFFNLKEYLECGAGRKVDLVTEHSLRKQWEQRILEQVRYL